MMQSHTGPQSDEELRAANVARCRAVITRLNDESGWELDSTSEAAYAAEIVRILPAGCDDQRLERIVRYYHTEHPIVLALRDAGRPEHQLAWERWVRIVAGELRRQGLSRMADRAIEDADVVQEALAELARQLPRYRYEAKFSVWAYRVIAAAALTMLQHSGAKKRSAIQISYDPERDADAVVDPVLVEEHVWKRMFALQAAQALGESAPDRRLARILQLYAADQRTFREIGALLGLSHAHVKGLYDQALAVLRSHPDVRAWDTDESAEMLEQEKRYE